MRASPWAPVAAALGVALATALAVGAVHEYWQRHVEAETSLARLDADAHELKAVEWQVIASGVASADLLGDLRDSRSRAEAEISRLPQLGISAQRVTDIERAYAAYADAVDEEFGHIALGDLAGARALDEVLVDPRFDALHSLIDEASEWTRTQAARSDRIAQAVQATSLLGAGALLGLLFWRFDRSRRAVVLAAAGRREAERINAERGKLLVRTVQATEDERIRIAADLHDGPIQRLTTLTYRLELANRRLLRGDFEDIARTLEDLQGELSEEIRSIRRTMTSLRPPVLDHGGLVTALRDHLDAVHDAFGLSGALDANGVGRLDPHVETVLYRITQEALNNAVKHSHASHVRVSLRAWEASVELSVRDDGVGLDPSAMAAAGRAGHVGLAGMRERAEMAGGTFEIRSRPGDGTAVVVRVPREVGSP